jgi:hypothetical protein
MMMSWLVMLIIQPFLIKYGKYKTHRMLGKLGYVLAPIVCYSMFVITGVKYHREIAIMPESDALAGACLDFPDIFYFGLLFALAMINRHKPNIHARYMAGTAVLILPPAIGRAIIIFGGLPPLTGIHTSHFIADTLTLLLLFHDFKKRINIKPALTIAIIVIIRHLFFISAHTVFCQKIAKWFVTTFL